MEAATAKMPYAAPQSVANLLWCFGTLVFSEPSPDSRMRGAGGGAPAAAQLHTRSMLALLRTAVQRINQDPDGFSAYELAGRTGRPTLYPVYSATHLC